MNIFTANQVNQVYVLKDNSTVVELDNSNDVTKANELGTVGVGKTSDGKSIYFKHYGAGGVTRSDLIKIENIIDIKKTPAKSMQVKMLSAVVSLNSEALSSSKPIAGEDYILRLKFQNPIGMSPDNQYWKYGVVHATADMSASDFYLKLASSLAKNMSRDAVQLVRVYVNYSTSGRTEVTADSDITDTATFDQTYTGITVIAVAQEWILGIKQQKPIIFTVEPDLIDNGTDEVVWGDVVYSNNKKLTGGVAPAYSVVTSGAPAAPVLKNSKLMADYEYFYMGERADQYRMVNWPDYIPTKYLVDPDNAYGYDTIGIHFSYVGSNHAVQKSEKDITFIIPRAAGDGDNPTIGSKATSLYNAIVDAVGDPSYYDSSDSE